MAETSFPSHVGLEPIEEAKPIVALKVHTPALDAPFEWNEKDPEDAE